MHETFVYKILMFIKACFMALITIVILLFFIGMLGLVFVGIPYYFIINNMEITGAILAILLGCIFPAINEFNKRGP